MKKILRIISFIGLGMTVIPAFLAFSDVISLEANNWIMLIGTLMWFGTAPFAFQSKANT